MKTILVTGGNRGIGLEICRQLDASGHDVIMGARDLERGLKAAEPLSSNIMVRQLDVRDEESIRKLFDFMNAEKGKLDVLINNAGVTEKTFFSQKKTIYSVKNFLETNIYGVRKIKNVLMSVARKTGLVPERKTASDISLDFVKEIMETNLYGPWRMIQVFIPLLRRSESPRIINISSGSGARKSLTGEYAAYSMSKYSLNALTIMFSRLLAEQNISVNSVCPGWVKTDMGGTNAPRDVKQGADTAVWLATQENIPTGKFFRDRKEIDW